MCTHYLQPDSQNRQGFITLRHICSRKNNSKKSLFLLQRIRTDLREQECEKFTNKEAKASPITFSANRSRELAKRCFFSNNNLHIQIANAHMRENVFCFREKEPVSRSPISVLYRSVLRFRVKAVFEWAKFKVTKIDSAQKSRSAGLANRFDSVRCANNFVSFFFLVGKKCF